ncbi:unannotated protein [freshwater metagenome]|uniref:Unannotated protein n=1 Tax=freshwater metagenome TaxID=449393 RepID=A0A6J7IFA5_9ZZZZ|nr:hypothetical protein [Actinomycetota bacterium]
MTDQPIKSIYLARRNPRLERGRFAARWRRHGELALSLPFMNPCIGYFHNDVAEHPPVAADPYTGDLWSGDYDGVGVVMFPGGASLESLLTHPTFPILLADEYGAFHELVEEFTTLNHERMIRWRIGTAAQFFAFLRAKDGVSREEFARRWELHLQHVMRSPALAEYVIQYSHNTPLASDETGDADAATRERLTIGSLTDVAGIAQVGFASWSDMEAYLSHPDREAIRDDLAEFADLGRSVMVAANEVTMKATALLR